MTNLELSKSWAAFSSSNTACPSRFLKVGEKERCGNEVEIPAKKRPKVFNNSVQIRANKRTDKHNPDIFKL